MMTLNKEEEMRHLRETNTAKEIVRVPRIWKSKAGVCCEADAVPSLAIIEQRT